MKCFISILILALFCGCYSHNEKSKEKSIPPTPLSGIQELDVEVASFRPSMKCRQSWFFGFRKSGESEEFTLELRDNDDFATSFIKDNPEFIKNYWKERRIAFKKHKNRNYIKPVIPPQKYHIKVDIKPSISRILEWKKME